VTLVDTNILLDLLTGDPVWSDWSERSLRQAAAMGKLYINDVVYAEISVRFGTIETLEEFVAELELQRLSADRASLFLAGKAFARYRSSGGTRTTLLPDLFIGAQAAVADMPV
jgi:predicted nucleic acid-binding protein